MLHCAQESEKRCLDRWQNIYVFWELRKKEFSDRIVPQGQLSDKANGEIEALTGDKRSGKFVFIAPVCLIVDEIAIPELYKCCALLFLAQTYPGIL